MCSSTGPKIFGPPTGVVSGGTFAPPVNYASNAQTTAAAPPAPTPTAPTPAPAAPTMPQGQGPDSDAPASGLQRKINNPFTASWGAGSSSMRNVFRQ